MRCSCVGKISNGMTRGQQCATWRVAGLDIKNRKELDTLPADVSNSRQGVIAVTCGIDFGLAPRLPLHFGEPWKLGCWGPKPPDHQLCEHVEFSEVTL